MDCVCISELPAFLSQADLLELRIAGSTFKRSCTDELVNTLISDMLDEDSEDDDDDPYYHVKWSRRVLRSLKILRVVVEKGSADVIEAVGEVAWYLEPYDFAEHEAVIETLSSIAGTPCCDEAVGAMIDELCHPILGGKIMKSAKKGLERIGVKGSTYAMQRVTELLANEAGHILYAALRALPIIAERGDDNAIRLLLPLLAHSNEDVREAAVDSLGDLATTGDEKMLSHILSRLADDHVDVRYGAAKAVARVARKDDPVVVKALLQLWSETGRFNRAREQAARSLRIVSQRGNDQVVNAVIAQLAHTEVEAQRDAIELLVDVADKGHEPSLLALFRRAKQVVSKPEMLTDDTGLTDWKYEQWRVQECALRNLVKLSGGSSAQVEAWVMELMIHERPCVRWLATSLLPDAAVKESGRAVQALLGRLEDAAQVYNYAYVCEVAAKALPKLVRKGDASTIAYLIAFAGSQEHAIDCRCSALHALELLVSRGDQSVVKLCLYLEDDILVEKPCALQLLAVASDYNDEVVVLKVLDVLMKVLCSCKFSMLRHRSLQCLKVLKQLRASNCLHDIDSFERCLSCDSPASRALAMELLPSLTPVRDRSFVTAVVKGLRDDKSEVRHAAVLALQTLQPDSDQSAALQSTLLSELFSDSSEVVRAAAVRAFSKLLSVSDCAGIRLIAQHAKKGDAHLANKRKAMKDKESPVKKRKTQDERIVSYSSLVQQTARDALSALATAGSSLAESFLEDNGS